MENVQRGRRREPKRLMRFLDIMSYQLMGRLIEVIYYVNNRKNESFKRVS